MWKAVWSIGLRVETSLFIIKFCEDVLKWGTLAVELSVTGYKLRVKCLIGEAAKLCAKGNYLWRASGLLLLNDECLSSSSLAIKASFFLLYGLPISWASSINLSDWAGSWSCSWSSAIRHINNDSSNSLANGRQKIPPTYASNSS